MYRTVAFGFVLTLSAGFATAQLKIESEPTPDESKEVAPPRPKVERLPNGVIMIRGSGSSRPAAESAAESAAKPAEEPAEPPAAAPKREKRQAAGYRYDVNGRRVPEPAATAAIKTADGAAATLTLTNLNGREVPYLKEKEEIILQTDQKTVAERRIQRYDVNGRPTRQDLEKIERRKLPDGSVETVVTRFEQDVSGRLQAESREVKREKTTGSKTETVVTTEAPSINGGFETKTRETTIEERHGEDSAKTETVRAAAVGNKMIVVAREESTLSKSGSTATTETKVFEKEDLSGKLTLTSKTVGTREELPDGGVSEKIETSGYRTNGPINLNATRLEVQEVIERRVTVGPDGEKRELVTTRARTAANPDEFGPPTVIERVSRPTPDGETVRTDTYEGGVNGRLRPTESVVEKVKK